MILPRFDFHRPADVAEAVDMLAVLGDGAKLLAGGTDLLVNMKHGAVKPRSLICLEGLAELAGRETAGEGLALGSGITAARIAADTAMPAALALGAGALGSPQVRNRATIGGNLATARPAADMCVPLLALGAEVLLAGPGGERRVALDGFFLGPGQTVAEANEVLTKVLLPAPKAGTGSGYQKLGLRRSLEISLVNVAAWLRLADDGATIAEARVSLGAVAPTPILSPGAADALAGAPAGEDSFARAAAAAAQDARPIDDHRGSAEYRRDMVAVLTRRCLADALADARRGGEARS